MKSTLSRRPKRLPFTRPRLEKLPVPIDGREYHYDAHVPSLACCVTSAGSRTFYVYRKANGRPVRVRLGRVDELTVDDARKLTLRIIGEIAEGKDPQAERIAKRGETTLGELFDYWLEHHARPHKRTWREDQKSFDRYLHGWRNRCLSAIRRPTIQALHVRVGADHGIYAANRLRGLLHTLFAKAAVDLGFEGANPVKGIRKFHEKSRERFLQADEFPRFWAALEAEPSTVCRDFFKIALLTGARRGNVLSMRWDEVHLDRATWAIPDTKTGDSLTVALSPEAIAILRERLANNPAGCPWVFPGHVKGTHLTDPMRPWKAVLQRAGLSDLRIHDLRRTMGSWQAASGASLPVIGKSLGHKLASTTSIYARLNLDSVRESVNRATAAMMIAAKPPKENTNGQDEAKGKAKRKRKATKPR